MGNTVTVMRLEIQRRAGLLWFFEDLSQKRREMKIKENRNRQKPDISLAVICTN